MSTPLSYGDFADEVMSFLDSTPENLERHFQALGYCWLNLDPNLPKIDPASFGNCSFMFRLCAEYAATGNMPPALRRLKAGWEANKGQRRAS